MLASPVKKVKTSGATRGAISCPRLQTGAAGD